MKIFKTSQIKALDQYTIEHEPISSYNLMGRAVQRLFDAMLPLLERERKVIVLAGPGNNGGDALVLAKMLCLIGQPVEAFLFDNGKLSSDCQQAKNDALRFGIQIHENAIEELKPASDDLIIDGLFGAGLSREITGLYADVIRLVNGSGCEIWAIDIPSGLMGEDNSTNGEAIVKANRTFTFQQPKLSFLFAENEKFVGTLQVINIDLHPLAIQNTDSDYSILEVNQINLHPRNKFSHKGTYGHGLLIAGKYGMAGAAILASRSALRMGMGLLSTHIPSQIYNIIQSTVPEAIVDIDKNTECFSGVQSFSRYSAIGIGPGLGTDGVTAQALRQTLELCQHDTPLVIDADALNIIAQNKELLKLLPHNTIITPHPKEFDRICGDSRTGFERLCKGIELAKEYQIIVVIKGANTSIVFPNGKVVFNSTGNPGMATAGSGDVLTGIILSLLAQHYSQEDAATYGVYLHGLAGDIAAEKLSEECVTASDLIDNLPYAIKLVKNKNYK